MSYFKMKKFSTQLNWINPFLSKSPAKFNKIFKAIKILKWQFMTVSKNLSQLILWILKIVGTAQNVSKREKL